MSTVELDRLQVVQRVAERRLTATEAAEQLSISRRQMARLMSAYEAK